MTWLYVGFGAALGGMLRYALSLFLTSGGQIFPYGTLAANVIGGFGMGVVLACSQTIGTELRLFFAVGVLGGLTTFSTFSAETFGLIQSGKVWIAVVHVSIHVLSALLMTALAYHLTRYLQR